ETVCKWVRWNEYIIDVFFFQAEDGIRDRNVTGVQTCALPISLQNVYICKVNTSVSQEANVRQCNYRRNLTHYQIDHALIAFQLRSEERRVGKECRARWWAAG